MTASASYGSRAAWYETRSRISRRNTRLLDWISAVRSERFRGMYHVSKPGNSGPLAPIGLMPIGLAPIGLAPIGPASIGPASIGLASIGLAPGGLLPVESLTGKTTRRASAG